MKKQIVKKPISVEEYHRLKNFHPLTDLILNTGARIAEVKRLIDEWDGKDYLDIKTKKSGDYTNRIYLNDKAIECLKKLNDFKNKSIRTIGRKITDISKSIGIKFSSHNLRSTFATTLIMLGVDLVSVQHLMNHSDISITAQYIRFDENHLRTSLNVLEMENTFEGMTVPELKNEIIKLRTRIMRIEMYKVWELKGIDNE